MARFSLRTTLSIHLLIRHFRKTAESDCQPRQSVCPSVCMEQMSSHETDFYGIWYFSNFRKSVEVIHVSLKSDKNIKYLHVDLFTCSCVIRSCSVLLRFRNISGQIIEKIKKYSVCFVFFPPKTLPSVRQCGKYGTTRQATDDNIIWPLRLVG